MSASARGLDFLRFVAGLGFDGVLFGPGGITSAGNRSPYDATLLSRNPLALSYAALGDAAWGHAVSAAELAAVADGMHTRRVDHAHAHAAVERLLGVCHEAARAGKIPDLDGRLARGEIDTDEYRDLVDTIRGGDRRGIVDDRS